MKLQVLGGGSCSWEGSGYEICVGRELLAEVVTVGIGVVDDGCVDEGAGGGGVGGEDVGTPDCAFPKVLSISHQK